MIPHKKNRAVISVYLYQCSYCGCYDSGHFTLRLAYPPVYFELEAELESGVEIHGSVTQRHLKVFHQLQVLTYGFNLSTRGSAQTAQGKIFTEPRGLDLLKAWTRID